MKDNAEAMVWAAFAADSLALGVHWIYDPQRIAQKFGRVETLLKPSGDSFHATKDIGEFTHYGDQLMVLLASVAEKGGFNLYDFSERWQNLFKDYQGYFDQATQGTLLNFSHGAGPENAGSSSNDLAGAARISPLILCCREDLEALVRAVRAQTQMTHSDPITVDSGEFFARVAYKGLRGESPSSAVSIVARENFADSPIASWVSEGMDSKFMDSVQTITRFGQFCETPAAFPSVIHLITKYENDLKEALIQNVMAGGDSAGRGMMVGTVLGVYLGPDAFPDEWMEGLKKKAEIKAYLRKLQENT